MAYSVVASTEAMLEIETIAAYLAERSERVAGSFLVEIDECFARLADMPTLYGFARDPYLAFLCYRTAVVGPYVVLYKFEGDEVRVAHCFHERQDYARLV